MADNLNAAELKIVARFVDEASSPLRALTGEVQRLGTGTSFAAVQNLAPAANTASAALSGTAKQGVFAFAQVEKAAKPATEAMEKAGKAAEGIGAKGSVGIAELLIKSKSSADALGLLARNLDLVGLRGPASLAAVSSSAAATGQTIGQLSVGVTGLGIAIAGAAVAVGGMFLLAKALSAAVAAAADFEREFSRVNLLLNQSTEANAKLRAEVYALSRAYNIEAKTAATAFYVAIEEGASTAAEASAVVETSVKISAAGFADLAVAVQTVSDTLDVYGERAGTVEEVGNKLALLSTRTGTSFTQLGRGFGTILPVAEQLGAGFDEVASILEVLKGTGLSARKSFAALGQTFTALANPEIRKALRGYGVEISDLRIRAEGITPTILDINRVIEANREELSKVIPAFSGFGLVIGKVAANADQLAPSLRALKTDKDFLDDAAAKRMAESFNVLDKAGKSISSRFDELFGTKTLDGLADFVRLLGQQENLLKAIDLAARAASDALGFYFKQLNGILAIAGLTADAAAAIVKFFETAKDAKDSIGEAPEKSDALTFIQAFGKEVLNQIIPVNKLSDAVDKFNRSSSGPLAGTGLKAQAEAAKKLEEQLASAEKYQNLVIGRFKQSIPLIIETEGVEEAIRRTEEFGAKIAAAREKMGLAGKGSFDALQALAQAIRGFVGQVSEVPQQLTDGVTTYEARFRKLVGVAENAAGDIVGVFKNIRESEAFAPFIISPFEATDIQQAVDGALRDFKAVPLDVELVFPDTVVEDAAKTLREFRGSGDFFKPVELLDEKQARAIADALAVMARFNEQVGKAKELADGFRESTLTGVDAERAKLEASFADTEKKIAALESFGFKVAGFRALFEKSKAVGFAAINEEIAEAAKKTADEQARIQQASADAANRIRATFAGFDKQLLSGFAAERAALDQSIEAARAEFEKLANDPTQTAGTRALARIAIDNLPEVKAALSDALDLTQQLAQAEALGEEFSKLSALKVQGLDGAEGEMLRLVDATLAQVDAEQRRRDELYLNADATDEQIALVDRQIEQLQKLGSLEFGKLAFDLTFRPKIDVDNKRLRDEVIAEFQPTLDALQEDLRIAPEIDAPGIRAKIAEVVDAMRAARIEAQQASERFGVGFTDGIAASVEEFTDQARIGFEFARDTADLLSDSISTLIQDLVKGKASFKDFVASILAGFTKLIADILAQRLTASLLGGVFGATSGAVGGFGIPEGGIFAQGGIMPGEMVSRRAFARGGVMPGQMLGMNAMQSTANLGTTLPIRKYAMGGVATSPQQAIFAEKPGMAEAFVPLPGPGRGIPVEFKDKGRGDGGTNITVNYTVHAMDARSVEQLLESHGRKIGDIAAGQIATRSNRALVTSIRGTQR